MEIEIEVDAMERRDFELKTLRQDWATGGMKCPVTGCDNSHYSRFGRFLDHWARFHNKHVTLSWCGQCGKLYKKRSHAKAHVKIHRPVASIISEERPNHENRDPEDVLPPRPPRQDTQIHEEAQLQAQEERRCWPSRWCSREEQHLSDLKYLYIHAESE
ncbi:uncharacterized protein LOC125378210 [Haliotis rufescens]|uniref:uncharacterized protein LOC125378210 n=1 Tax=Haliotis rufescens TaxID=6454 RepID=UPI00201EDB10|nr:uncharacterized protein LOC125378210 [Haliotis rufescens]